MKTKVGGVWKDTAPKAKVNGAWREASNAWVMVNGVWRKFYTSYEEMNEFTMQVEAPTNGTARIQIVNAEGITIDWGDGTITSVTSSNWYAKTYPTAGTYRVTIKGTRANTVVVESEFLTKVLGFGRLSVANYQFKSSRLTQVPNKLIAGIYDLQSMFSGCSSFNQDISGWDMSQVQNLANMFNGCTAFNQNLAAWNTSAVLNMYRTFYGCSSFNQDIGLWLTSNVNNMAEMFSGASKFNQDLSKWCVSKITSKPANFDLNASAWTKPRPAWGTCPAR